MTRPLTTLTAYVSADQMASVHIAREIGLMPEIKQALAAKRAVTEQSESRDAGKLGRAM